MTNIKDNKKSDFTKFCRVTRELHKRLEFPKDEYTVQDRVFHVSFESTEFSEKDSEAKSKKNEQVLLSIEKSCKRAVILQKENSKRVISEYSAYDMREYSL